MTIGYDREWPNVSLVNKINSYVFIIVRYLHQYVNGSIVTDKERKNERCLGGCIGVSTNLHRFPYDIVVSIITLSYSYIWIIKVAVIYYSFLSRKPASQIRRLKLFVHVVHPLYFDSSRPFSVEGDVIKRAERGRNRWVWQQLWLVNRVLLPAAMF